MRQRLLPFIVALAVVLGLTAPAAQAQLSGEAKFAKAVKEGDMRAIQEWMVNGGNLNVRDGKGVPVLVTATRLGMDSVVKYLIANGADPNIEIRATGETAIMLAAEKTNNAKVINLLVASGADPNMVDKRGETALMKAARVGNRRAARALIQSGADVDVEDYTGRTALQIARDRRRLGVVDVLNSAAELTNRSPAPYRDPR